ncbi:tRNA (adenine(22)-N(1))-methyltransferase [Desulfotruncus alcoholivorax]|uniref:tRNA (adenine(22)-N(1))-methyltransferase n=1 Tax=Desulfotruncus alcoholivorax TaxID=265477 RepID=UPI00041CC548|nr:class I SAM-dependent methyltransferase [Desulfotruncus alcoholivorax]
MVGLSKRLAAVARHIPSGSVVADIGTDHAFLPVYLIQTGKAKKVLAGEVTPGPYHTARETVRSFKLEQQIDVRIGNGLAIMQPGEADVAVLAGMGGRTIISILIAGSEVLEAIKRLIIQPMRDVTVVRRWLVENGWCLADEEMVYEDGHYYVIITAEKGNEKIVDEFILNVGPRLLEKKDNILVDYLKKRFANIDVVLKRLDDAKSDEARLRASLLIKEKEKIREVLELCQ